MRRLIWSSTFIRASKRAIRKTPTLRADIEKTLRDLIEDPFLPHLGTHKLKGKLSGSWACSVGYNLRIVFDFVEDEKRE
uniref:mRNA-degrading endonuclease (mRNA interferase) YafQ, toxin component of the YafQ-DinJ toxin-antitoxin module n=1 Tax=Candidatus Kentrum eta TaxID=2126337 RepID=A0A450UR47_9GAMM|nr:MAG: mRNA-degrading endonuclease (mRNA interferase) YafQ, toxin component of the YafQ-DinJ toxin-antitoxin module [Candidatus Kentron sp. H]VFJ95762.1 MAG: mRNA-degrading endonuclease (mRNA interferase) YafQ, toxin component of the YafQ-DinJ toxin-antitoxin module [Candidatus Kentron sp. H]VFK01972.1 MAG: mRNA-degrading endonuclease (mRNA interferase) YafQ, toxin component of the YafQ-DinJ toxin-antitoxin module [Candidatus Kentron sp. H]